MDETRATRRSRWPLRIALVLLFLGVVAGVAAVAWPKTLDAKVAGAASLIRRGELDAAETALEEVRALPLSGERGVAELETVRRLRSAGAGLRDATAAEVARLRELLVGELDAAGLGRLAPEISFLDGIEADGRIPLLLDRNGAVLAAFDRQTGEVDFDAELFAGWIGTLAGLPGTDRTWTTLDLGLQRAAAAAMDGYRGVLLVSEPKTGEILAAFGTEGMPPFATRFEPGPIAASLAFEAFVAAGGDDRSGSTDSHSARASGATRHPWQRVSWVSRSRGTLPA